jgi:hypothetical protein
MKKSRARLWHLMLAVVVVAVCARALQLGVLPLVTARLAVRPFYYARSSLRKTWNVGVSPTLIVDNFAGTVEVIEGSGSVVSAEIDLDVISRRSQLEADRAASGVNIATSLESNTVEIVTTRSPFATSYSVESRITIRVPPGTTADINTNDGPVLVGEAYDRRGQLFRVPTALRGLKAKTSRVYDYISVRLAPGTDLAAGGNLAPRVVDLECRDGYIRVVADQVVVNARTHGTAAGPIFFEGTLAKGNHSFVSNSLIQMLVPSAAPYQFDAEAPKGGVVNEFDPYERPQPLRPMTETVRDEHESRVILRSSEGSIKIAKIKNKTAGDEQPLIQVDTAKRGEKDNDISIIIRTE